MPVQTGQKAQYSMAGLWGNDRDRGTGLHMGGADVQNELVQGGKATRPRQWPDLFTHQRWLVQPLFKARA